MILPAEHFLSRENGWYAIDFHSHFQHGENEVLRSLDEVKELCQRSGLAFFGLGQQWGVGFERAVADCRAISDQYIQILPAPEIPKNYYRGNAGECLGHGYIIGNLDGRTYAELETINAGDYQTEKARMPNFASFARIRRAGCVAVYSHPLRCWYGAWGGRSGYPRQENMFISNLALELPFDTTFGPYYDGVDVVMSNHECRDNEMAFQLWCNLLDAGYRITAMGSSDCCFDRRGKPQPGASRTFVQCPVASPDLADVQRGIREMKCLATNGPLLSAKMEEKCFAGLHLSPTDSPLTVKVQSEFPGYGGALQIELIRDGEISMVFTQDIAAAKAEFSAEIDISSPGWWVIRSYDRTKQYHAVLNPCFVDAGPHVTPVPPMSSVELKVMDGSDVVSTGQVTLLDYANRPESPAVATRRFADGRITVECRADCWLRVEAAGYPAKEICLFFSEPIFGVVRDLEKEKLISPGLFREFRNQVARLAIQIDLAQACFPSCYQGYRF